jgi:LysR family transcriptional regulator for bpeEF and oprC
MLEDAEIFVSVAEYKSFSKAARKLKLSAPIVTRHIAKLENELGVRLLQRNTRQVSLTEAGITFYESCLDLLKTYTITLKQVKNFSNELAGTLKIGLPSSISHLYVTAALSQFIKKYPNIKIDIINGNHLIDLLSDGFDLIVHCGELSNSNLYCRKLGEWKKITCASPGYLKSYGTPKTPDNLRNHNCLDHFDNVDHSWKYLTDNEIKSIPVCGNIRINNSMDLKELALAGIGIVYLPSFTVQKEIQKDSLKSILNDYQVPPLGMYAVYPTNRFLSTKAKVFIEFLSSLRMTHL